MATTVPVPLYPAFQVFGTVMISLLERLLGFADSAFSCSFSVVAVSPVVLEAVVS